MKDDFMEKFAKWIMITIVSLLLLGIPVGVFGFWVPQYRDIVIWVWIWVILAVILFGLVVWTISMLIDLINEDHK
jgi:hypothetical protein